MNSRLVFRCCTCGREGSRAESYVSKPGECPGFEDRCPACKRDNIEVLDPRMSAIDEMPARLRKAS